jgi:hypothetical protein
VDSLHGRQMFELLAHSLSLRILSHLTNTIPRIPISSPTIISLSQRHVDITTILRTDTFITIPRTETLARVTCPSWKPYGRFTRSNVAFTAGPPVVLPSLFVTCRSLDSTPPPRRLRGHFRQRDVGSAWNGLQGGWPGNRDRVKTAGIGEIGRILEGRVGLDRVRVTGRCVSKSAVSAGGVIEG